MPKGKYARKKIVAKVRPLDPSDPRSLEHPCHREQWLAFAEALGSSLACQEWERMEGRLSVPADRERMQAHDHRHTKKPISLRSKVANLDGG